jgi:hypothetical protein
MKELTKKIIVVSLLVILALILPANAMVFYSGGVAIGNNSIVPITPDQVSPYGLLHIGINARVTTFSNTIEITALTPKNGTVTPAITNSVVKPELISTYFDASAPSAYCTLPACGLDTETLNAGTYEIELVDGNGGQPEYALVNIVDGKDTYLNFQGHAVTEYSAPTYTIVSAQYGAYNVTGTTMADVTQYFQSVIHGSTNAVTVTDPRGPDWAWLNAIQSVQSSFGDPASGTEKGLVINYEINNGAELTLVIPNVYYSSSDYVVSGNTAATLTL